MTEGQNSFVKTYRRSHDNFVFATGACLLNKQLTTHAVSVSRVGRLSRLRDEQLSRSHFPKNTDVVSI